MANRNRVNAARKAAMRARILKTYAEASADDLASGLAWYDRAQAAAARIAEGTSVTTETVAGIITALSPRTAWATNVAWAAQVVAAYEGGAIHPPNVHTRQMRAQAWRIVNGEHPLDVMGGPKVRAFFANITGDHNAVTVDVWACRIAEGSFVPHSRKSGHNFAAIPAPAGKYYELVADAYREAAAIIGQTPPPNRASCHMGLCPWRCGVRAIHDRQRTPERVLSHDAGLRRPNPGRFGHRRRRRNYRLLQRN